MERFDFIRCRKKAGELVYVASLDIDGTFNKVPNDRLMATLSRLRIDPYILRFLSRWLRTRRFSALLATTTELLYGARRPITRGLPQGGVLSPFHRAASSLRWAARGGAAYGLGMDWRTASGLCSGQILCGQHRICSCTWGPHCYCARGNPAPRAITTNTSHNSHV